MGREEETPMTSSYSHKQIKHRQKESKRGQNGRKRKGRKKRLEKGQKQDTELQRGRAYHFELEGSEGAVNVVTNS